MNARRLGLMLLLGGALAALAGFSQHARQVDIPLRFALPKAGETAEERFVARSDASFEIELEVLLGELDAAGETALRDAKSGSPVRFSWQISEDKEMIARGGSEDYLYLSRWVDLPSRFRDRLLRRADHRSIRNGSSSRGVGAFSTRMGEEYVVRVDHHEIPPSVLAAQPRVVVRLSRAEAKARRRKADGPLILGAFSLILGALILGFSGRRR